MQKRGRHRCRDHFGSCEMGWVNEMKGFRSANWWLHSDDGNVVYSIDNIVNNIS